MPRLDKACRLARDAERLLSATINAFFGARLERSINSLRTGLATAATRPPSLPSEPLQPQPQPASAGRLAAGSVARAASARTRSLVLTADLPWLDMALRRAMEALLPGAAETAGAVARAAGRGGAIATAGAGAAGMGACRTGAADPEIPDLPPLDMARRLANAAARPFVPLLLPLCAIANTP